MEYIIVVTGLSLAAWLSATLVKNSIVMAYVSQWREKRSRKLSINNDTKP